MMTKTLIAALLAAVAVPAMAQVAGPAPAAPPMPRMEMAQPMTRAQVAAQVQAHFAMADTNHDGVITDAEMKAGRDAMKARIGQRMAARAPGAPAMPRAPMAAMDHGKMFDRMDANHDGAITRAEFDAHHASLGKMHGEGMAKMKMRHDGMRGERKWGGKMGMGVMKGADANKDGRITLAEAQAAALAHFDMMDSNKDGTVSPEERKAMRGHMAPMGMKKAG